MDSHNSLSVKNLEKLELPKIKAMKATTAAIEHPTKMTLDSDDFVGLDKNGF